MSGPALSRGEREAPVKIRRALPEDGTICGAICYAAFRKVNADHGFPPDIPEPQRAILMLTYLFAHPGYYCVVAESGGRVLGSNCLDERSAIAGIGPITIDPEAQNASVGRRLMEAVLERARERGSAGTRLVQAAFHNRSLSLYSKLGFDAREPLSVMQGPAIRQAVDGCYVRPAVGDDVEACNRICLKVHGHDRGKELEDGLEQGTAVVAERSGRITGYSSGMSFFGHTVGESTTDVEALIAAAEDFGGPGILVPTRNAALFRWCLDRGLRVVEPMTLMTTGLYNEPAGAWLPSILF